MTDQTFIVRACMSYEFRRGSKATVAAKNICEAFGDQAVSERVQKTVVGPRPAFKFNTKTGYPPQEGNAFRLVEREENNSIMNFSDPIKQLMRIFLNNN